MTTTRHKLLFASATVLFLVLLATSTVHLSRPRYQGKTGQDWLREAVEDRRLLPSVARRSEPGGQLNPLMVRARAFRRMGDRGIRLVVNTYLAEPPAYLEWYDKAARALGGLVRLPTRAQRTSAQEADTARQLLLAIGHPAAPELIRRTYSRDPATRGRAANLLGELGPGNDETQARLQEMLGDPSTLVVYQSLEVLWMTSPEPATAIPAILPFLTHTNRRVRVEASYAIGSLTPTPELTLKPLQSALSDLNATVRANAARAIGLAGAPSEPTLKLLEAQLSDSSPVARFRAAEALARLCGRGALDRSARLATVIAEAQASPDSYYSLMGLIGRIALGEVDAVDGLLIETCFELLSSNEPYVRRDALGGLSRLIEACEGESDPLIRSLLLIAGEDLNGCIRHMATNTLHHVMMSRGSTRTHSDPTSLPSLDPAGRSRFP